MKVSQLFSLLLIVGLFFGCKNDKSSTENVTTPEPAAAAQAQGVAKYPICTSEMMQNLWQNSDGLDIIFYELPISMSQDNAESVRQSLSYIAAEQALVSDQCKAAGRVSFKVKGSITQEADIFLGPMCNYYIFYDKQNKPLYANKMNSQGVAFFNQLIGSVKQAPAQ